MKLNFLSICLLLLFLSGSSHAQERDWTLTGYVKDLFMYYHPKPFDGFSIDDQYTNTVHNRLNFEWLPTDELTVVIENRNRLIAGNLVRNFPTYKSGMKTDQGYFDLSAIPFDGDSWFLHSMIDRAYIDWSAGNWQIRLGRQRVNWGVNLVWNPNDLFNSFSYFDFDYEERPGTDAARIQYYTGATSSAELVYKLGDSPNNMALAGLYRFSNWNYDFQFLGGWVGPDLVVGCGWSGDIKGAGFRGEFSQFIPRQSGSDSQSATVASVSADYTFASSLYIHFSALFNSLGGKGRTDLNPVMTENLSAKSLAFGKYELFGQCSYPITPLLNASSVLIVNPADGSMYLGPSASYSLQTNIELMLTGQFFLGNAESEYGNIGQLAFARLKWSF
ncbi:hypothetical protein [Mangrovibacterium marinum]|uniref:Porin n=1 Tax=Mangrovibacterium marinum TaxID=1639118 RepID=A0A2T5C554_9BACT|nr:hypothetical protein [Mangrovibacterium marinum]PTN09970.1 hypothetical protein C8N47_103267 [Mangrovibacterium marinum]